MDVHREDTAIVFIDTQSDVLSEKGLSCDLKAGTNVSRNAPVIYTQTALKILSNRKALFAVDRRLRLTRRLARRRIEVGFPVAHFFYQLLIDTADGLRGQWTTLS
jgi:hypothetical protein